MTIWHPFSSCPPNRFTSSFTKPKSNLQLKSKWQTGWMRTIEELSQIYELWIQACLQAPKAKQSVLQIMIKFHSCKSRVTSSFENIWVAVHPDKRISFGGWKIIKHFTSQMKQIYSTPASEVTEVHSTLNSPFSHVRLSPDWRCSRPSLWQRKSTKHHGLRYGAANTDYWARFENRTTPNKLRSAEVRWEVADHFCFETGTIFNKVFKYHTVVNLKTAM